LKTSSTDTALAGDDADDGEIIPVNPKQLLVVDSSKSRRFLLVAKA
jgi:hypothetical protein